MVKMQHKCVFNFVPILHGDSEIPLEDYAWMYAQSIMLEMIQHKKESAYYNVQLFQTDMLIQI